MIVPMKKVFVAVQRKDSASTVEQMARLGTVHVEHLNVPKSDLVDQLKAEVDLLGRVVDILEQQKFDIKQVALSDWREQANEMIKLVADINQWRESFDKRALEIARWETWGNFDPQDIALLSQRGIYVYLCELTKSDHARLPANVAVEVIQSTKNLDRCAVISQYPLTLPVSVVALPQESLAQMKLKQDEERILIANAVKDIKTHCQYLQSFKKTLSFKNEELKLAETNSGMQQEGEIVLLKGFCPADAVEQLVKEGQKLGWATLVEDPSDEDYVPTLVKNPEWINMIKPMFGIMNIVPGYRERDISIFFLIFFSIFFSLLVGDAGYGTIFLFITIFAHIKFGAKLQDKAILGLMYVLSVCTIIWGILTGTVFGTLLFGQTIKPVLPWLTDAKNLQFLCFLLGVIHLTIAHIWRSISRGPNLGGLSEIGWIMALWGSFFLANMMLVGIPMPGFAKYLYIIGAVLIIADIIAQKKDIFVNLILFIFSMINTFGDIVSYIRLFAVGLAGVAVADAFNQMALGIGFSNVFTAVGAIFILAFVHLFLNLALCVMGVLVHGVRLNVLEFSGHLGMEWSGTEYKPLKLSDKQHS
jgi:V/A-type H+-transporting ATPase subunit I